MDIRNDHRVEIRRVGSEKALVRVDNLNEDEATKVFKNITFPTVRVKGEFEKAIIWRETAVRKQDL
ncbi:hypothetical protein I5M27_12910 [Adhaeribacter sp. BT258]|uniref:Uncharacterized protein n=1 Tax=Adhaeribacter terrigena TaxID=2793070 RepID=A0ABS1C3B4_9BACT|nr:hypothetical protein [Adhaeribacter terrigena]MBK0403888.1 hypothetical protein [Adhaeribacter terrigena]